MKKKNYESGQGLCPIPKKFLLVMKLTTFLIVIFTMNTTATVYSQNTKLSLNLKETSIKMESLSKKPNINQQQKSVSGKVTDQTGGSLPGVSVIIKGTTNGTITDTDGKYSLPNVPENATLQFSFIGMKIYEVAVKGKTSINVKLEEETISIGEVVAIGYGTQQKRDVSGSITNVTEKNFNKGVIRTATDLLEGKVAGLVITSGSGDVSSDQTIRLRGTSSLTGSSAPFVVIDGVPGLSLNSVSPQDIESISVLKDASAAAIYGSRSASGVILITTKKGKEGQSSVDYNGYVAADFVSNKPDVLTATEWRNYCSKNSVNTEGLDKGANTNWFDEIMRMGITQNHDLSLSGGGVKSNYRASVSYQDRQGVVKDNYMKRLNSRLTFNQKALDDRLNITLTGAINQREYSPSDTYNFVLAYNMLPVYPVKNADGTWFDSKEYDQGNPVRNITYNKHLHKNNMIYVNGKADLQILKGLTASVNALKEQETDDYGQYNDSQTQEGRNDNGYAQRSFSSSDKNLLETTANYKMEIGEQKLSFLGGYSYEENKYQAAGAQNRQFATDFFGFNNLNAGENLRAGDVWSSANMNKLVSFFGRVNYSLKECYILTATLRRDGSTKFGKNHKWGTFPSISGAWRLLEEPFMKNTNLFDDLKLRASYGIAGNQDGLNPYQSLELYGTSGQYYDNGQWYTAYQISQNANPDLKWEQTAMFNLGIDYSLLNHRINGSIEYYNKKTKDLLYNYQVPVPPYLYPDMIANVGDMSNKGFEVVINGDIIRKDDLKWTMSVNFAHNKNMITKLSNANFTTESIKTGDAWIRGGSSNTTSIVEEGKPVGTFYGWKSNGLDANGKYIMDDMIDGEPGLTEEDKTDIGCAQPDLTYGIYSSVTWKKFEFSFFLRGVHGNDVLNFSKMSYATTQWLPGANVLHEAVTSNFTDNPKYCSYYIEKGSFLRMDNASIAYNFDTKNWWGIHKLRVYLTGQNLFTITNYTGLDPEVDMSGLAPGLEGRDYYPKARTVSMGVNLSF